MATAIEQPQEEDLRAHGMRSGEHAPDDAPPSPEVREKKTVPKREIIRKSESERRFHEDVLFEERKFSSMFESLEKIQKASAHACETHEKFSETFEVQTDIKALEKEVQDLFTRAHRLFEGANNCLQKLGGDKARQLDDLSLETFVLDSARGFVEKLAAELARAEEKISALKKLEEERREKAKAESGFSSVDDIRRAEAKKHLEYIGLYNSYFGAGRLLHRSRLGELRRELSGLDDTARDIGADSTSYWDRTRTEYGEKLERLQREALRKVANIWELRQYEFGKDISNARTREITPEALTELKDAFMTEAAKKLNEAAENAGEPVSPENIRSAQDILNEMYDDAALFRDTKGRSMLWQSAAYQKLPYRLKSALEIVADKIPRMEDLKLIGKFADLSLMREGLAEKEDMYKRLSRKIAPLQKDTHLFWIMNPASGQEQFRELGTMPLGTLEVFFDSRAMGQVYENKFGLIENNLSKFFARELVKSEPRSDRAIALGYKLGRFKSGETAPIYIFNAFREGGYSGEMPFVSIHFGSANTEVYKYVKNLTPEELREIEVENVPGVMDAIRLIGENPDTFAHPYFYNEGIQDKPNPVHEELDAALGKMGIHYILQGTREFGMYGLSKIRPALNAENYKTVEEYLIKTDSSEALDFFASALFSEDNHLVFPIVKNILNNEKISGKIKRSLLGQLALRANSYKDWRNSEWTRESYGPSLLSSELIFMQALEFDDPGQKFYALESLMNLGADVPDQKKYLLDLVKTVNRLGYDDRGLRDQIFTLIREKPDIFTKEEAQFIAESDYGDPSLMLMFLLRGQIDETSVFKKKFAEFMKDRGYVSVGTYEGLTEGLELNEKSWPALFVKCVGLLNGAGADHGEDGRVREMFVNGNGKDFAWEEFKKSWREALNSGTPEIPVKLLWVADYARAAVPLKYFRALGGLTSELSRVFGREGTAERTKTEIQRGLSLQEDRFSKARWSEEERANFYNVSQRIITVAPSLYTDFLNVFDGLSPKDLKQFIETEMPLYEAALIVMRNPGKQPYNPRELVELRRSLEALQTNLARSKDKPSAIFKNGRGEVLGILQNSLHEKFGLKKAPSEINEGHIRSIQDVLRYLGNLSGRNFEKETLLTFFLGLELNGEWEKLRRGEEINPEEYFDGERLEVLHTYFTERKKSENITPEIVGVSPEDWPEFQKVLQEEVLLKRIGNIETIDMKVGNVYRNLRDLEDEDAYEDPKDKALISFLKGRESLAGAALAKTFGRVSGKKIELSEDESKCATELGRILGVEEWTAETVKAAQDRIKMPTLILKTVRKAEDVGVQGAIGELQRRLQPSEGVVQIFNKLGEEFKIASGALALSQDVAYLEKLKIKSEDKLSEEEKRAVDLYLGSITESLQSLEKLYEQLKEYFFSMKQSLHRSSGKALRERMDEIEKTITQSTENVEVTSRVTNNLNLIIENIRQCLGCLSSGCNNDTDLTFGDSNKFFLMSQTSDELEGKAMEQVSVADEIAFFTPSKDEKGNQSGTFVLDLMYGAKTSEVMLSHAATIAKKIRRIKERFPDAKLSILIPLSSLASSGADGEILGRKIEEETKARARLGALDVEIPPSAAGEHYVEFGLGGGRSRGGKGKIAGLVIEA